MNSIEGGDNQMQQSNGKIRIGRIDYTNVWPIFFYLPYDQLDPRLEFIQQVPTQLNRGMASGEIDMGPISAFAYAAAYPDYLLYPNLSVSALGKVNSILLFHKKPLEEIANGRIKLPTTSASSVNLLKIILQKFYGGSPDYAYEEPSLEQMMRDADGALLIGDDAIRASWTSHPYLVTDLGEKWYELTGLWMSFAVWAIRKDTSRRYPETVSLLFDAFLRSKEQGMREPEAMVREAQRTIGGTEEYWSNYFRQLTYDFGPDQWKGLTTYYKYAKELGLLEREVSVELWTDKTAAQVNE